MLGVLVLALVIVIFMKFLPEMLKVLFYLLLILLLMVMIFGLSSEELIIWVKRVLLFVLS